MNLRRDTPYWLLVAGCLAWLGVVFYTAFARGNGLSGGDLLFSCFRPLCHQIPERSFHAFGSVLPVCHRCVGLYIGFTAGLLTFPYLTGLRGILLRTPRWVLVFFAPMAIDVFLLPNTYLSRFLTGFVAGFPVALFLWAAAAQLTQRSTLSIPGGKSYDERFTG